MKRRKSFYRVKKHENALSNKKCRDCKHSYDWNSKALDGSFVLCRCPYKRNGGKWCIFLSDRACEHFDQRNDNLNEQIRQTTHQERREI